jgi:hypothetical protein
MKLRTALICLLLLAIAVPAFAQGSLFLNHGNCSAVSPAKNKNLNCNSTTINDLVVASVAVANPLVDVIADLGIVDVVAGSNPTVMPLFWQFQTGGCSGTSNLLFSADFSGGPFDCADLWGGTGSTGGQYGGQAGPIPDGNRARIKWSTAVLPDPISAPEMDPDVEYYIEKLTFKQARAVACTLATCQVPVCAVYVHEEFAQLSGIPYVVENNPDFITFNGATNCPGATPTNQSSWGRVKSLYR